MIKFYFRHVFIAFDQFVNALLGGYCDETFSSRCHRLGKTSSFWAFMEDVLDILFYLIEKDHCYLAYQSELEKKHYPRELRD